MAFRAAALLETVLRLAFLSSHCFSDWYMPAQRVKEIANYLCLFASFKNLNGVSVVKVSVVIPTYNRAHVVGRSIDSALNQTYQDIEILIVDDRSTDETFEAVKPFFRHPQVRYLRHEKNKGHQAARNTGIRNARGDYVAFLNSDDTWIPEKIELQLDAINKKGEDRVVLTGWKMVNGPRQRLFEKHYEGYVYPELLASDGPGYGCMLVPRERLRQIGFLDESILAFADWKTCISPSKLFEFDRAGEFGRSKAHMITAFKIDSTNPVLFLLALSALFGGRVYHLVLTLFKRVGSIKNVRSSRQLAPA
jgi:glycosyltransferase involved in cell wall biosynthesis